MRAFLPLLFALLWASNTALADASELAEILQPRQVTENIFYFKGSLDARSYDNYSLNNNLGFVTTDEGVILIDTGASYQSGELIAKAIATVTDQPIRWVINTGSQDHRWMGNGYFAEQGAEIIALARTVATQRHYAQSHLRRSEGILKDRLHGTVPVHAGQPIQADHHSMQLGGVTLELIYAGDAHFPGDIMLWLPEHEVIFSGDVVYLDRLVGIHPWSDIHGIRASFAKLESLSPKFIVPGHGYLSDLAKARAEAGDYYEFVYEGVRAAVEDFVDMVETVNQLSDAPQFSHLLHFDEWHRLNINRVYLQLEAE